MFSALEMIIYRFFLILDKSECEEKKIL